MTNIPWRLCRLCRLTGVRRARTSFLASALALQTACITTTTTSTTPPHSSALCDTKTNTRHEKNAAEVYTPRLSHYANLAHDANVCEQRVTNGLAQLLHLPSRFLWDMPASSSYLKDCAEQPPGHRPTRALEQFTWTPVARRADGSLVPFAAQPRASKHTSLTSFSVRSAAASHVAAFVSASSLSPTTYCEHNNKRKSEEISGGGGGVLHRSRLESYLALLHTASLQALTAATSSPPTTTTNTTAACAQTILSHQHSVVHAAPLAWRPSQEEVSRLRGRLVLYCGDQVDPVLLSAAKVMQLGHVRVLQTIPQPPTSDAHLTRASAASSAAGGGFTMSQLRAAMQEDIAAGLLPCMVVGVFGSRYAGAVDPLAACAALCARMNVWFHIDASYGGLSLLAVAEVRAGRAKNRSEAISARHERSSGNENSMSTQSDSSSSSSSGSALGNEKEEELTVQLLNLQGSTAEAHSRIRKTRNTSRPAHAQLTRDVASQTSSSSAHEPWRQGALNFYKAARSADSILLSCTADAFADITASLLFLPPEESRTRLAPTHASIDCTLWNNELAVLYVAAVRKVAYVQHELTQLSSSSSTIDGGSGSSCGGAAYSMTALSGSSLSNYRCDAIRTATTTITVQDEECADSMTSVLHALHWPSHPALPSIAWQCAGQRHRTSSSAPHTVLSHMADHLARQVRLRSRASQPHHATASHNTASRPAEDERNTTQHDEEDETALVWCTAPAMQVRYRQCVLSDVMCALRADGRFDTDASSRCCTGFNLVLFRWRMLSDTATEALARRCQRYAMQQPAQQQTQQQTQQQEEENTYEEGNGAAIADEARTANTPSVTFALHTVQKRVWVAMRTTHSGKCTSKGLAEEVQAIMQLVRRAAHEVEVGTGG